MCYIWKQSEVLNKCRCIKEPDRTHFTQFDYWLVSLKNVLIRKRSLIRGSRKDTGLKGIKETRDLYIGWCHTFVSIDEIVKYINDVTGIQPISGIQISKPEVTVKAFKVTVGSSDIEKLLDAEVWPENICVRKNLNRRPRYFPANW